MTEHHCFGCQYFGGWGVGLLLAFNIQYSVLVETNSKSDTHEKKVFIIYYNEMIQTDFKTLNMHDRLMKTP